MSKTERQAEIKKEIDRLANERREYMKIVMRNFDEKQNKQIKNLRKECEEIGHYGTSYHSNGLGSSCKYCWHCGAAFDRRSWSE